MQYGLSLMVGAVDVQQKRLMLTVGGSTDMQVTTSIFQIIFLIIFLVKPVGCRRSIRAVRMSYAIIIYVVDIQGNF